MELFCHVGAARAVTWLGGSRGWWGAGSRCAQVSFSVTAYRENMGKLQEFEIAFHKNKVVYSPGESITGTVTIKVNQPLACKGESPLNSSLFPQLWLTCSVDGTVAKRGSEGSHLVKVTRPLWVFALEVVFKVYINVGVVVCGKGLAMTV